MAAHERDRVVGAHPEEIVATVRRVARGQPVLSPAVSRRLIARAAGSELDLNIRVQIALLVHDAGLLDDQE